MFYPECLVVLVDIASSNRRLGNAIEMTFEVDIEDLNVHTVMNLLPSYFDKTLTYCTEFSYSPSDMQEKMKGGAESVDATLT